MYCRGHTKGRQENLKDEWKHGWKLVVNMNMQN